MGKTNRLRSPYALLMVTMLLWGSAFSSSKSLVGHVPHSVGAFLRFGGAALALLLAMAVSGSRRARVPARNGWRAAAAGVLGVFAYNGFFFWGLSLAPSLDAGILIPVMSPVLTSTFLLATGKEKPTWARVTGLALGLTGAGTFFLGAGGSGGGGSSRLPGDALFLLSAVCWASYTLAGPRVLTGVEPLKATTYATCAGALLLGVLAAPDAADVAWSDLPVGVWLNTAFLAVGAAAVANLLYYRGVGTVGPARASLMMFNVPVINTLCATLLLDESLGWVQGIGALVLVLGAVIAVTQGRLPWRATGARTQSRVVAAGPAEDEGAQAGNA
ncbi:DMT family transporter [Streptomyces sp. NPDC059740]|uniref:DMT family transporter n=1 Tax=Streptomyces sp. NPDC059740 TaxID=3346926 RepID=UPI00365867D3